MATTELHRAVESGRLSDVHCCLEDPTVNIDAFNIYGHTALYIAASKGHDAIALELLAAGASVDRTTEGWPTPLAGAAGHNFEQMVDILLAAGADINSGDRTPLWHAAFNNHVAIVRLLLAQGADVEKGGKGAPLHGAARNDHLEIMEMLLSAGANPNVRIPSESIGVGKWTPLHYSSNRGSTAAIKLLVDHGADINAANDEGDTSLHVSGDPKVVQLLISLGADYKIKNDRAQTPLQRACNFVISYGYNMNKAHYGATVAALVASGDREWDFVPSPCPGLETALLPVWREAPHELGHLFQRLSVGSKEQVQRCLRVLHGRLPQEDLRMRILDLVLNSKDDDF